MVASGPSEGTKAFRLTKVMKGVSAGLGLGWRSPVPQTNYIRQKVKTSHRAQFIPDRAETHSWIQSLVQETHNS